MKKALLVIISFLIISPLTEARQISKANFIEDVNILFLKGDYAGLIKNTEVNLKYSRLNTKAKKEVLYLMGLSYIKMSNFTKARISFNDILTMKGDEFRQDSYIGIADSYFYEENFDKAIKTYQEVLNMYPKSARTSNIYYKLGLIYKAEKEFDKAGSYFQKIKDEYRTSFEADKISYVPIEKSPSYYIIQLGAFSDLRNAKALVRRLSRKGHDSYIQKVEKEGNVLYRVRGGKFTNKHHAMKLVNKLKKNRFPAKIIVE